MPQNLAARHGDVKQQSFVHVLAPAPPSSAHAAAVEVVGKGALDNLRTQLEGLAGDPGLKTHSVVGDRASISARWSTA